MGIYRRIQVVESSGISVVNFVDRKILDEANIEELGEELYYLVETEKRSKIVLNFSVVEFLSSAALGKLISLEKKTRSNKAELVLTNIRPEIYDVFAITNLNKLFKIMATEADALAVL